jgi:16S rRNA processing protein RimM
VDGLDDRELARELIGWLIQGEDELLPELADGEYYHRDLIGLQVYRQGELLGTLSEIHGTGPVDVWTVTSGQDEVFVPALKDLIERVDLEAGRIEVKG